MMDLMIKNILLVLMSLILFSCGGSGGGDGGGGGGDGDDDNSNTKVSINYIEPSNTEVSIKSFDKTSISLIFPEVNCKIDKNGSISYKAAGTKYLSISRTNGTSFGRSITSNEYTIDGLTPDASYNLTFKVTCYDPFNNQNKATIEKTMTQKTKAEGYSITVSNKVISKMDVNHTDFTMGWVEAQCRQGARPVDEYYQTKFCKKDTTDCSQNDVTSTSYKATGLTPETAYSFDITAICSDDNAVSTTYTTKYIDTEAVPDLTVPRITSSVIFNDFAIDGSVDITFSESVSSCNFALSTGGSNVAHSPVWSSDNTSVNIKPNNDLINNKEHQLVVSACSDGSNTMVNKTITIKTIKFPAQIAPTVSVDDDANTFQWALFGSFVNSDFEYSFSGGLDWSEATNNALNVGNNEYEVGKICVRVKTSITQSESTKACNAEAFTGSREKILGNPLGDVASETFRRTMRFRFLASTGENLTITSLRITGLSCFPEAHKVVGTINHIKSNGDVIEVYKTALSSCLGGSVNYNVSKTIKVFLGDTVVLSVFAPSSFTSGNFDSTEHVVSITESW